MAYEKNLNNTNVIMDYSILVKDIKAKKRLRIAIYSWVTWEDQGGKVATTSTYNDNIVINKTIGQLTNNKENVDFGDVVFRFSEITAIDISWTIPEEWYFELVLNIILDEEKHHSEKTNSTFTNFMPGEIYRFISKINNISFAEKIACILDIYNLNTECLDKLKTKIDQDYSKIQKIISWMENPSNLEAEKTIHVDNAIEKIYKGMFNFFPKGKIKAKICIVRNRDQLGFCEAVLNAARKSWNQQCRRNSGLTKQLGLSVKTETAKKLASLAEKYSLSETQVLETLIRSEFRKEIYLKEITAITKAIEDQ